MPSVDSDGPGSSGRGLKSWELATDDPLPESDDEALECVRDGVLVYSD